MMKFNLDDYKGKYVMWCPTIEEAEDFCIFLQQNDRTWNTDSKYTEDNNWDIYKKDTCYLFNAGLYSNLEYVQQHGYTVLRWNSFKKGDNTMNNNDNNDTINNSNDDKIIIEVQDYSEVYKTKLYKISKSGYNLLKTLDNDFDLFGNDIRINILDIKEIKEL